MMGEISEFIRHHYRHFNARELHTAAEAYVHHLEQGGKMIVTLAGAMSTAELGLSLAEMIREGKVHAISCTGANLEEDIFNLVAHEHYKCLPFKLVDENHNRSFPPYRELSAKDEEELKVRRLYRVTDTCIPEDVTWPSCRWKRPCSLNGSAPRRTANVVSHTSSFTGSCVTASSRIITR
jgi:deoxyhypusine synthase